MLKGAQNPKQMLEQQFQNNPLYKQMEEISKEYGGDYNKAFQETAKKNGIDPQIILSMLK